MTPDIEDAIRALRIAENHFDEAQGEYRVAATYELTAAIERYNAALAKAKAAEWSDYLDQKVKEATNAH